MLYHNTVSDLLGQCLHELIGASEFDPFRLVGGTALGLQLGHRISIDIDLFSDAPYGSIDFGAIDRFLEKQFHYKSDSGDFASALGKSYLIGTDRENAVKLDVYYTDQFIDAARVEDGIPMATLNDIVAMKLDVVQRIGRKKDFWDIHELLRHYDIAQMLALHERRYEFGHDRILILDHFKNFENADGDFDPICLKGKYWAFIKEDIIEAVDNYLAQEGSSLEF